MAAVQAVGRFGHARVSGNLPGLNGKFYPGNGRAGRFYDARKKPRPKPGLVFASELLQAIQDLVGPEALEPMKRLVERLEFVVADAADLFDRLDVLLIKRVDDVAHVLTLLGQLDAHGAAVNTRPLMIE